MTSRVQKAQKILGFDLRRSLSLWLITDCVIPAAIHPSIFAQGWLAVKECGIKGIPGAPH